MLRSVNPRLRRVASAVLVSAMAVGAAACGGGGGDNAAAHDYCAILPDSVGLYVGNPVTQMGLQVGTIDTISPSPTSVRVDFSITARRAVPEDVTAVVRSTSILADRALELVGNYDSGAMLMQGQCVPLSRSFTPKSLSEVIGAANTFINGINPSYSTNIAGTLGHVEQALHGNGAGINEILTTSSSLLESPDAAIGDLGSIVDKLSTLTGTLAQQRSTIKQILTDAEVTTPYLRQTVEGARDLAGPLPNIISAVSDIEIQGGDTIQLLLDQVSDVVRVTSPHARGLSTLLLGLAPYTINAIAKNVNNHVFNIGFRPPLYRVRTPNGGIVCLTMNATNPGSCAVVGGQPYFVDVNLLQYVFQAATQ
jgi:virulence factor Mce-like protein